MMATQGSDLFAPFLGFFENANDLLFTEPVLLHVRIPFSSKGILTFSVDQFLGSRSVSLSYLILNRISTGLATPMPETFGPGCFPWVGSLFLCELLHVNGWKQRPRDTQNVSASDPV